MLVLDRIGLRRFPALTSAVFAVTAVVNVLQWPVPGVLAGLERTPAGLHGDWWRSVTALFVQDGGVGGTLVNLIFLAVLGALAEQVLPRFRWAVQYFGVGVAVEFIAYAWQPVGGGNSIANCGLAAGLAVALWRRDAGLPDWAAVAVAVWSADMFATLSAWALLPAIVACALFIGPSRLLVARGVDLRRPAAALPVVVGVVLVAAANIHGAALILGVVTALVSDRLHKPAPVT
ncbi:rhomboid family intramembrane serine protease [Nocardia sp. NPDC088792]|uniref:rhomboid family intramembrane serine protease n=1 Tax=Nocardia sp. NPDC088792 TaxID=3364332 RepID=UPI00382DC879